MMATAPPSLPHAPKLQPDKRVIPPGRREILRSTLVATACVCGNNSATYVAILGTELGVATVTEIGAR